MRSIQEILWAVDDCSVTTREQARAIIEEESREYGEVLNVTPEIARQGLLKSIAKAARMLYTPGRQQQLAELFELDLKENDGNNRDNNSDPT